MKINFQLIFSVLWLGFLISIKIMSFFIIIISSVNLGFFMYLIIKGFQSYTSKIEY